jgi:hypothetical protein
MKRGEDALTKDLSNMGLSSARPGKFSGRQPIFIGNGVSSMKHFKN